MAMSDTATKRIPVTEEIWESLADLKKHGQTYDQLLAEMIALKQERDFLAHIDELEKHGEFVRLKDAAKELNIRESS
jgi:hypothetical protein